MKNPFLIFGVIVLAIVLLFVIFSNNDGPEIVVPNSQEELNQEEKTNEESTIIEGEKEDKSKTIIGQSVEGKDIVAYHFGEGSKELLFIGGIHGGYSWNTSLVAYQMIDYLKNKADIPNNLKITIVPVLNPDGLEQRIGTAGYFTASDVLNKEQILVESRFNANDVDLNRNFDCEWESEGLWRNQKVDGGTVVFSEPESQAIKNYIENKKPEAVLVWYSAAGGVFSSSCKNGILEETKKLTKLYADASGYKSYDEFISYEITGDMVNWLAKIGTPAISVLLTDHINSEWEKNKKGIDAILNHYSK